jgi:hypothetical protein
MRKTAMFVALAVLAALPISETSAGQDAAQTNQKTIRALLDTIDPSVVLNAATMLADGQKTFRVDSVKIARNSAPLRGGFRVQV